MSFGFIYCGKTIPNFVGPCGRAKGHEGPCASAQSYEAKADKRVAEAVHQAGNPTYEETRKVSGVTIAPQGKLTGGLTNYYLVRVLFPQREEQAPYTAECEDIIDALALTPDEANIFKEIWRSANARQGNGKPDHKALYGAEKIVHYAGRILRRLKRATQA